MKFLTLLLALAILPTHASYLKDEIVVSIFHPNVFGSWTHDTDDSNSTNDLGTMISYEKASLYPTIFTLQQTPEYSIVKSHTTLSIGKQIRYYYRHKVFTYAEMGLAANNRKTEASSTYLHVYGSIGVSYKSYRIGIRHTSNAYTGSVNDGEDILFFSYIF